MVRACRAMTGEDNVMTNHHGATAGPGERVRPAGSDAGSNTTDSATQRCRWCRRVLPQRVGPGRPRVFCSQRCRQWDWVSRQRAAELELSEHELVIARDELDRLYDDVFALTCAIEDTERDLAADGDRTVRELTEMLAWLLDAARPLRDTQFSASAPPSA